MLRERLWVGAVLIVLVVGMLLFDRRLGPWHPFLFVFVVGLALAACFELLHLLPPAQRRYGRPARTRASIAKTADCADRTAPSCQPIRWLRCSPAKWMGPSGSRSAR